MRGVTTWRQVTHWHGVRFTGLDEKIENESDENANVLACQEEADLRRPHLVLKVKTLTSQISSH